MWSTYTGKLRGAYAKVKANLAQVIPEVMANAQNKRWVENKDPKHDMDAKYGWYRYDIFFCTDVATENSMERRRNYYTATAVV